MPYLDHFGLKDYPFGLTPDTALFFPEPQACALLDGLMFSLDRGDGLLKVVGEVGTGKTLLSRLLLGRLTAQKFQTAYVNAPVALKSSDIAAKIAREFGVKCTATDDATEKLTNFLIKSHAKGQKCGVVVDEAQALGAEGLEAIRLLSNLETETEKLLQIVLFGQNELNRLLMKNSLRQIAQRIHFSFETKPFAPETVADYVRHRLSLVSHPAPKAAIFRQSTLTRLATFSQGLPRWIHILADKSLIAAYAEGSPTVTPHHLRLALKETKEIKVPWWKKLW